MIFLIREEGKSIVFHFAVTHNLLQNYKKKIHCNLGVLKEETELRISETINKFIYCKAKQINILTPIKGP